MPTSYKSQVFKSNPMVLPVDLNLLMQIGTIKQNQFNTGVAKTQAQVDTLGSLDVMRGVDREYLNSKINGLVNGINSLGGVDYSDLSVQNQIEGFGSDIYQDGNVITALSSTKSARNLLSSYENLKMNPKMKGMYSEVNEWYDGRKVQEWINNPNLGAAYQGPSSATPYTDYKSGYMKALEKVKADQNVTLDDKGLFIEKTTNKIVSPERIQQLVSDLLTPNERAQMKRDATFLYQQQAKLPPEQLINKALEQYSERVNSAQSIQQRYETLANAAVNDPVQRQNYLQLAANQKAQVDQLKSGAKTLTQNTINAYQSDPEEFMYQIYSNDFNRGLSNMFSYRQVDRSVQEDRAEMFTLRQAEDTRQFNLTYNQRDKFEQQKIDLDALKLGLKYEFDENGNRTLKKIPAGQLGSLETVDPNTGNPDDFKVSEAGLTKENQQRMIQIDQTYREALESLQATNPNMFETQQSNAAPGGWLYALKGQQDLENRNGRPGFQFEDLQGLDNATTRQSITAKGHLSEKDLTQLSQWYKDYEAITKGDKSLSGKLPQQFIGAVEKVQLLNLGLETNKSTMSAIDQAVIEEAISKAKLSPQEADILRGRQSVARQDYPNGYRLGQNPNTRRNPLSGSGTSSPNRDLSDILSKVKKAGFDIQARKEEYYKQRGSRDVRFGRAFSEEEVKNRGTEIQNFVYSDATVTGMTSLQGKSDLTADQIQAKNIRPLRQGVSSDGRPYVDSEVTVGSGDKVSTAMYRTYLSDKNAQSLGVFTDPYEEINHSLYMTGKADNLMIHGGTNLALKILIRKSTSNINDNSSQAWVYLPDGTNAPIPGASGQTGSEAYARAKVLVQEADKKGLKQQDLLTYIVNPADKKDLK